MDDAPRAEALRADEPDYTNL